MTLDALDLLAILLGLAGSLLAWASMLGSGQTPLPNPPTKGTDMKPKNSPEYKRTLTRWGELTRLQDERGLSVQEGGELLRLGQWLHASESSSIAALTDDYAETMLREAGHIGGVEW